MSEHACDQWIEAIAAHVFGDLSGNENLGLRSHIEGCAHCQALVREMTETFEMLQYVERDAIATPALPSAELSRRVLSGLRSFGDRQRRTRRLVSIGLVGAVAVSLIVVGLLTGESTSPSLRRTVALRGDASVKATVELTAQSWGTAVHLTERGLPSGTLYTVSIESTDGTWWAAGTYRSVSGKTVDATMTCAVAIQEIKAVRVVNGNDATVLRN